MTSPSHDEYRQALATATRLETPCGAGSVVWHAWGDGKPLVLLHGGGGSWTHWLRNVTALAATGRRVLVPDLPGFGDSALPPQGNDADVLADPIEQGLHALVGDTPCEVVGFSFGAMVGGFLATTEPRRVSRLVLVGAPGLGVSPRGAVVLHPWRHLKDPAEVEAAHRANIAALMLYRPEGVGGLALQIHEANVVRERLKGRQLAYTDVLARMLADVRCPVYALYGREDALYRPNTAGLETVFRRAPDFRGLTLIEGAGHWVQFEAPDAVNRALAFSLSEKIGQGSQA